MKKRNVSPPFENPLVAVVFDDYSDPERERLLELRALIFDVAKETEGVGTIEETLKWNQPSYVTSESKSGSTLRIDRLRSDVPQVAMYFNCQTTLVPSIREMYGPIFTYEKNRALHFTTDAELPEDEVRDCIAMALTYHLRKKRKKKKGPRG